MAVTKSLEAWWRGSQRAADILSSPEVTPESWHRAFIDEIVPAFWIGLLAEVHLWRHWPGARLRV